MAKQYLPRHLVFLIYLYFSFTIFLKLVDELLNLLKNKKYEVVKYVSKKLKLKWYWNIYNENHNKTTFSRLALLFF